MVLMDMQELLNIVLSMELMWQQKQEQQTLQKIDGYVDLQIIMLVQHGMDLMILKELTFLEQPAGLLFSGIMSEIHKGLENSTFKVPDKIVHATICRTSGRIATNKCSSTYDEIFVDGHLPEECDAHQNQYTICRESGRLANEFCPSKREDQLIML